MSDTRLRRALRLYLVSPDAWGVDPSDAERLRRLIDAGVHCVQFRDKSEAPHRHARAEQMQAICRAHGALFVVNDDPALARDLGADGVHVGESDASVAAARQIMGPLGIVGATANSLARARTAVTEGADYVGVGAIFDATASKGDAVTRGVAILSEMRADPVVATVPIVAIGGITLANAACCFDAGADGVAMIRGFWTLDDPSSVLVALRHPSAATESSF